MKITQDVDGVHIAIDVPYRMVFSLDVLTKKAEDLMRDDEVFPKDVAAVSQLSRLIDLMRDELRS